ncbi:MAG: hypothetical protein ABWW69_07120 [Pyrodictiaceae archaeon]
MLSRSTVAAVTPMDARGRMLMASLSLSMTLVGSLNRQNRYSGAHGVWRVACRRIVPPDAL